jgi:glycosyltransferase involved in cell wall biosynthesis
MEQVPAISVLMPVYNAERYVAEAVESILKQTFTDFEFLIINDGSTDRSRQILQRYAEQDSRIRLICRENRGLVATLNEMIDLARAPLLARMDADDVSYPERFAKQLEFIKKNQDVVCVGGMFELIDEKGRFLTRLHPPERDPEIQQLMLKGHTAICHPCAMMRTSIVRRVGGYDLTVPCAEDLDLWLRLGESGRLANMPDYLLKYRLNSDSVSERKGEEQRRDILNASQRAWQRRGITECFGATEHWRPDPTPSSQHAFMLKYGWWAFNSGQRRTAIIYGLKAIRILPVKIAGWKLLLASLVQPMTNHPPKQNS